MGKKSFSQLVLRFFSWCCPTHIHEEIEGDLIQQYYRDKIRFGKGAAERRLVWNTIKFFRLGILTRNNISLFKHQNLMVGNHIKVTLRLMLKNKAFSFINIFGLVTGMTICLFVAQFVWFEWSFESFNKNADYTYRVNLYNTTNGKFTQISAETVSGLGYRMRQSIPGVESIARLSDKIGAVVTNRHDNHQHLESDIVYADASIMDALAITLIRGDKNQILENPHSVIISQSVAHRYFGDMDAYGKILEINFGDGSIPANQYQIEGVFQDIPSNSHQYFDFILPPQNQQAWDENWAWSNVKTYITFAANTNVEDVKIALSEIVNKYHQDGKGDHYLLEPLSSIRLNALDGSGRATLVNFFILLGAIILLLAWFNYINLSTAQFFERIKEVGVRKVIGASRAQLMFQLLIESFVMNALSLSLALLLFFLCWPFITSVIQLPKSTSFFHESRSFVFLAGFLVAGAFCTGLYPSIFLSAFKPLQVIKGKLTNFADRSTLRKALVVVQISVSVVLITSMIAIQRQVSFMRGQDTGLSMDQTLVVEAPLVTDAATVQKFEPFKNEILRLPGVMGVTYASSFPGAEIDWHRTDITLEEENADYKYSSRIVAIGNEFLDVFDLHPIVGRNFSSQIEEDKKALLVNEKACKMFGFATYQEALNKVVFIGNRRFEVIGVIKDYHFRSLQHELQPILYMQGYPRNPAYAIRVTSKNMYESIGIIESKWKDTYTGNVFNYSFLNESFERQYDNEQQMGTIVVGLTFLAVFISCSGLFGLSLYSVSRRTKEIGIRKVLGATILDVVFLLSKDTIKLVVISSLVAVPLAYYCIERWLEEYAYKMHLDAMLFVSPVVVLLLLTLISISYQTVGAAKRNPVDSMKYE